MIRELARSICNSVQSPEGWRLGDKPVLQVVEGHLPAEALLLRRSVLFLLGVQLLDEPLHNPLPAASQSTDAIYIWNPAQNHVSGPHCPAKWHNTNRHINQTHVPDMCTLRLHFQAVRTLMRGKAETLHMGGPQTKRTQPFTLMGVQFTDRPCTQHISAFPAFPRETEASGRTLLLDA